MSISHLLEDFGTTMDGTMVSLTDVSLEEQRLEAFEKGYQAGWEDAVKAQRETALRVSEDLAQNLQALSFTYQEARGAVIESLGPLLRQMVETVLPQLAHQSLPDRVAQEVESIIDRMGEHAIEIRAAPADIDAIEALLNDQPIGNVHVLPEASLAEGQVGIRLGDSEREIDLQDVLNGIERAVTGFFDANHKETA